MLVLWFFFFFWSCYFGNWLNTLRLFRTISKLVYVLILGKRKVRKWYLASLPPLCYCESWLRLGP